MPFYEYECQNCKFYSEVMQKISDEPLKKCPSCGKDTMIKLISAPNFRLKGGGWYETDFKSDSENKRNLAGPDKEESKPSTEVASSDSKSDTKASTPKPTESKPAAVESKPVVTTKKPTVAAKASKPSKKPAARPSRPVAKKKAAKKARR
jgi:putative FmdB family regulatory protein